MLTGVRLMTGTEYRETRAGGRSEFRAASLTGRAGDGVPSQGLWFVTP